jgi:hypothetical protein
MTCALEGLSQGSCTSSTRSPSTGIPRNSLLCAPLPVGQNSPWQRQPLNRCKGCEWMQTTLRHLGVPVDATSCMFGDNGSVVMSSTMPDSQLNRCHLALCHHCVREATTPGMVEFCHIPGEINPSDVLSKHWGHVELWPRPKTLLFW